MNINWFWYCRLVVEFGYEFLKDEWVFYMNFLIGELVRKFGEVEWVRDKMVMVNL